MFGFYNIGYLRIFLLCMLAGLVDCTHDLDVPLHNNVPSLGINSPRELIDTLWYPDSTVCTLSVKDLNDTRLLVTDTSWPGTSEYLNEGLGEKKIALMLPADSLGLFSDTLNSFGKFDSVFISDPSGAYVSVPYHIHKMFQDQFLDNPASMTYWKSFDDPSDSIGIIRHDPTSTYTGLALYFKADATIPAQERLLSLTSKFSLCGDFKISLNYLMSIGSVTDTFRVGFKLSTTTDTSILDASIADLWIVAKGNILKYEYDVGALSQEDRFQTREILNGPLFMERRDSMLTIYRVSYSGKRDIVANSAYVFTLKPVYLSISSLTNTNSINDRFFRVTNLTIDKGAMKLE